MNRVTLSLISHTNVGKTTLARTLLRQDIGDALDQAHVTDTNQSFVLLESEGEELVLWDTPGFGDTARLLKRLKQNEKPFGWVMTQVWDRLADRPLFCSQEAIRNVRDESDVVLYLVNAAEDPESAAYVGMELQIMQWMKKPVLVLLNQTGPPRGAEEEQAEEERWRSVVGEWDAVKGVLSLDAFARCWVQEDELLDAVAGVVEGERAKPAARLAEAWKARNLGVFEESTRLIAEQLASSASDAVKVTKETLAQKFWIGRAKINVELKKARGTLVDRLAERTAEATNGLIVLHGLEGETARRMGEISRESFAVPEKVNESIWSAIGGVAAGAATGLVVDLHAGGLSFGGGAVLGGLGGGAGAFYLAKGLNLAKRKDDSVHWTFEHFKEQTSLALLSYLAVSHFGRGRGRWEDSEEPAFWREMIDAVVEDREGKLEKLWKDGAAGKDVADGVRKWVGKALETVLERLYPATA